MVEEATEEVMVVTEEEVLVQLEMVKVMVVTRKMGIGLIAMVVTEVVVMAAVVKGEEEMVATEVGEEVMVEEATEEVMVVTEEEAMEEATDEVLVISFSEKVAM